MPIHRQWQTSESLSTSLSVLLPLLLLLLLATTVAAAASSFCPEACCYQYASVCCGKKLSWQFAFSAKVNTIISNGSGGENDDIKSEINSLMLQFAWRALHAAECRLDADDDSKPLNIRSLHRLS